MGARHIRQVVFVADADSDSDVAQLGEGDDVRAGPGGAAAEEEGLQSGGRLLAHSADDGTGGACGRGNAYNARVVRSNSINGVC